MPPTPTDGCTFAAILEIAPLSQDRAVADIATMTDSLSPRRPNIELIERERPSVRLRLVTAYYGVSAGIFAALLTVSAAASVVGGFPSVSMALDPQRAAIAVVVLASRVQTYRLLRDRRRSGAVAAAIPVIISVATMFRDNAPIGWLNLLGSLLGLVMLATVWKELE